MAGTESESERGRVAAEAWRRVKQGGVVSLIAGDTDDRVLAGLAVTLAIFMVTASNHIGFCRALAVTAAIAVIAGLLLRFVPHR